MFINYLTFLAHTRMTILWLLFVLLSFSSELSIADRNFNFRNDEYRPCPESILNGKYKWKYRNRNYTASEGEVCWLNERELVLRKCNTITGQWMPSQVSCMKKDTIKKNKYCPEDLFEVLHNDRDNKVICLKISSETQIFNEAYCYGSNIVAHELSNNEANSIYTYLLERGIEKFWLPLRRYNDNSFSAYSLRLPGKNWASALDVVLPNKHGRLSYEHCLILRYDQQALNTDKKQKTFSLDVTNCETLAHSVCIFRKELAIASGCPKGFAALTYQPNVCYGVYKPKKHQLLDEPQRHLTVADFFDKQNIINLILKKLELHNKYFKVGTFEDELRDKYAVLTNGRGDIQIENSMNKKFQLIIRLKIDQQNNVNMFLKMDIESKELVLVVYNRRHIWRLEDDDVKDYGIKCFTNSDYDEWRTVKLSLIWENAEQSKTIFKLKLVGDGPGEYWCEAHNIFGFQLMRSNRFIAVKERRGHAFAMHIKIPFKELHMDELTCVNVHGNLKQLSKTLRDILNDYKNSREHRETLNDLIIHNLRTMKIEDCNTTCIRASVQITISLKSSSVDNSEERSSEEDDSYENYQNIRHDTSVRMHLRSLLVQLLINRHPYVIKSIRSTEFCFPETFKIHNGGQNQWLLARLNQTATTLNLCIQQSGIPATRKCVGSFLEGAYWEGTENQSEREVVCYMLDRYDRNITESLYNLDKSKLPKQAPERAISHIKHVLRDSIDKLIPADLYYLAKIIYNSVKGISSIELTTENISSANSSLVTATTTTAATMRDIIKIYNYLMNINEWIITPSIVLNSTNILLDAFELFFDKVSMMELLQLKSTNLTLSDLNFNQSTLVGSTTNQQEDNFDVIEYTDIGVTLKMANNILIFTFDPTVAALSGVAIFRCTNNSTSEDESLGLLHGAFENEYFRFLQTNHTFEDLLSEPDLLIGTYVPGSLLSRLDEISNVMNATHKSPPIVVIKIYGNDKLFQEENVNRTGIGRVISISIPNYDSDLPEYLPLALRVYNHQHNVETDGIDYDSYEDARNTSLEDGNYSVPALGCSYWNYKAWVSDGMTFLGRSPINKDLILCGCMHLTPFAYLIGGNYNFSVDSEIEVVTWQIHEKALDIITLIGCFLSLLGIAGIFVTAATFQMWRSKASSKVLLQLSAAIALQMLIFCFVNTKEYSLHLIKNDFISQCVALGATLHYSVLVQFCWMFVIAYLQFKRYVKVFANNRPKRFFIKSTLFGWGTPLIPVSIVVLVAGGSFTKTEFCYPTGYALYFGVILPILLIVVSNMAIFCMIIYNILKGPSVTIRRTDKRMIISQIRLSILLFFLLGFTWIFGLLAVLKVGIIFSYLFSLTATLQGFIIFVYFIILDPITRRMWNSHLRNIFGKEKIFSSESSLSIKETTQVS